MSSLAVLQHVTAHMTVAILHVTETREWVWRLTSCNFRTKLVKCPVPGCPSNLSSYALLLKHLQGLVRRNRCGAFEGTVAFRCSCGDILTTVTQVRVHCMKHMNRRQLPTIPIPPHEDVPAFNHSSEDEVDNPSVMLPIEILDEATEVEMSEGGGDVMYMYADAPCSDGSESEEEEEDVIDWSAGSRITSDSQLNVLMDLCFYAYDSLLTERCYRTLRQLPLFTDYDYIPHSLKHLRRQVDEHLCQIFCFPSTRLHTFRHNDRTFEVPYLSVKDILTVWFSVPAIFKAVRESNFVHLPPSLVDLEVFDAFIRRRNDAATNRMFSYDCIQIGASYLDRVRSCIPSFKDEYLRAIDDGCDILLCTVGLYSDNFSKHLNSLVSESMFCLTLRK